ncbi:MAG: SMI1/KNR4 family protein [Selenomonadales bacterium]|nr:SMI1/KNR4 family protein [Selenomonadales bacterium]
MWRALLKRYEGVNNRLNAPVDTEEIAAAERALSVAFPTELKDLLCELNGDNWLLFSVSQIVEINLMTREALGQYYDKLDELLFIAGNGCGDYYAYKICVGEADTGRIVFWDHEDNSRRVVASSLSELITRYYSDEI